VRISEPRFLGNVRVAELTQSIGMFRDLTNWGLAVKGRAGIFNPGLSETDLGLIEARMSRVSEESHPPKPESGLVQQVIERQQTFFRLYEKEVEDHFDAILRGLDLTLYRCADGRSAEGLAAARRAVMLDPLNPMTHDSLGGALHFARRYSEAVAAFKDGLALSPEHAEISVFLGLNYYLLGDFESARAACEAHPEYWASGLCLAMTYEKLGRHTQAEAELRKLKASWGDAAAYMYANIYAQWGYTKQALEWLEKALQLRDQGLQVLKTDPLMDPLRKEPRFQAVERALKFPT
jgi:tetratricopeptide (TPR) repeat protein